jgi:hypothetical protein
MVDEKVRQDRSANASPEPLHYTIDNSLIHRETTTIREEFASLVAWWQAFSMSFKSMDY